MRTLRAAAFLTISLGLTVSAAACGNSSQGTASGAAVYAPASSTVFVTVNTDTEGGQWQALDALLAKFPDGKGAIDKALSEFGAEEGLDFETDIKPAVGNELAVVGFDAEGDEVVLLTQPEDPAKLKEIVGSGDDPGVTEELGDGWWAAAESQESLDRFDKARESGDSLADDDAYRDATDDLFDDAFATMYVNGRLAEQVEGSSDELPGAEAALAKCLGGEDASGASFALAARVEDDGVRIAGDVASKVVPSDGGGTLELDKLFRSDALVYATVSNLGDGIRKIADCAASNDSETAQTLAQIELALGVSLDDDVAHLFDGSTGVAVYAPASDVGYTSFQPTIVVATEVDHEDEAMALIEQLVDRAGGLIGMMGGGEEAPISLEETSIGGLTAKVLVESGEPVLYIATTGGALVVSNSEDGLAALESGTSLADDPAYKDARLRAGVPNEASAVIWVNIADAAGLATTFLPAEGSTEYGPGASDPTANIEPLKSLFLWSEDPDDDSVSFEGFLQVD